MKTKLLLFSLIGINIFYYGCCSKVGFLPCPLDDRIYFTIKDKDYDSVKFECVNSIKLSISGFKGSKKLQTLSFKKSQFESDSYSASLPIEYDSLLNMKMYLYNDCLNISDSVMIMSVKKRQYTKEQTSCSYKDVQLCTSLDSLKCNINGKIVLTKNTILILIQ